VAQSEDGFAVEFGWGHRRLDDATYEPVVYPIGSPVDVWLATFKVRSSSLDRTPISMIELMEYLRCP
jgi:hypothetical protein